MKLKVLKVVGLLVVAIAMVGLNPLLGTIRDAQNKANQAMLLNATVLVTVNGGHGSGVVVGDNLVLTARHMVEGADKVTIVMRDGTSYEATDFVEDVDDDLALIRVEMVELAIIPLLTDLTDIAVGDETIHCGAPMSKEMAWTRTKGAIINILEGWEYWIKHVIMIDNYAAPGSSGGPVMCKGKLLSLVVGGDGTGNVCTEPIVDLDENIMAIIVGSKDAN